MLGNNDPGKRTANLHVCQVRIRSTNLDHAYLSLFVYNEQIVARCLRRLDVLR